MDILDNRALISKATSGFSIVMSELSISTPPLQVTSEQGQSYRLEKQTRALVRSVPELVPVIDQLQSNTRASEVITSLVARHDSTKSTLFSLGKASDIDNQVSRARKIRVLALAGGHGGDVLRLIRVREDKSSWDGHKGIRLDEPNFANGEEGRWTGNGSPLSQICFADENGEGGSWLAVRTQNSTTIFRPLYHRVPVKLSSPQHTTEIERSRLNPNPIVTVPASWTGGTSHADIGFNPWYQSQFAIVDQAGRWTVWDVEGQKKKRVTLKAVLRKSGLILDSSMPPHHADGWGSVCWAGDLNTLVVCDRRHFTVFDLSSEPPAPLPSPDLGIAKTVHWILDVKRSPSNLSHLYVVTSSHIFWVEVTGTHLLVNEGQKRYSGVRILLSWRHFRDGEDVSLQVLLVPSDEVLFVLLFSRMNNLVTVFESSGPSGTLSLPSSVADPFNLLLPRDGDDKESANTQDWRPKCVSSLMMIPLEYSMFPRVMPSGPGQAYLEQGLRFLKMLVLYNDLSVRSCIYAKQNVVADDPTQKRITLDNVQLPTLSLRRSGDAGRSTTRVIADSFVVDDGELEETSESELEGRFGEEQSSKDSIRARQRTKNVFDTSDPRTVDLEWLYEIAFTKGVVRRGDDTEMKATSGREDVDEQIEVLRRSLRGKQETGYQLIETLLELFPARSHVSDIDKMSYGFESLLQSIRHVDDGDGSTSRIISNQLISNSSLGILLPPTDDGNQISMAEGITLSKIYDHLVTTWVAPLPKSIPGKARVEMERMIRSTALAIYLSSFGVTLRRSEASESPDSTLHPAATPDNREEVAFHLPVRPKPTARPSTLEERHVSPFPTRSSPGPSSQSLPIDSSQPTLYSSPQGSPLSQPLPSRTRTSSTFSQSLTSSKFSESASSSRLRAYTHLTPQPALPSTLSTILTHWSPGADPNHYSYVATSRALDPSSSEGSSEGEGENARSRSGSGTSTSRRKKLSKMQEKKKKALTKSGKERQIPPSSMASAPQQVRTGGEEEDGGGRGGRPWMSQPVPRVGEGESSQITGATQNQGAVGASSSRLPASQIERGAFGGRLTGKAKKRKRMAGF
ncbi:MAG: hypothetical protein M1837_004779 [Sclerophora amabilis]|nr:MAG: hypothetical protein M1837_004779 [Sclerophora amabilis]